MEEVEKIVYFVRHGQSEGNASGDFQGPNSPLTDVGVKQAEQIAGRIMKIEFETLISSPLERAKRTAEEISKITSKEVVLSDLFVERRKPSRLNDQHRDNDEAVALWNEWEESLLNEGMQVEDGENFNSIYKRAGEALRFLKERPEKVLVVVTHGYFLRTMIAQVLLGEQATPEMFRHFIFRTSMENTGITAIKFKDGFRSSSWRLWIYNDHAHLG